MKSSKQFCRHQDQWRRRARRCSRYQSKDFPAAHREDRGDTWWPGGGNWWGLLQAAASSLRI